MGDAIGKIQALWVKIKPAVKVFPQNFLKAVFNPGDFFKTLEIQDGRYAAPLTYHFIVTFPIIAAVSFIEKRHIGEGVLERIFYILTIKPVWTCVCIFIIAGILHGFVKLFRGKNSFTGTLNVIAYSNAIPIISIAEFMAEKVAAASGTWQPGFAVMISGALLASIPVMIGFKHVHKMNWCLAILAALAPGILIFIISIFGIAVGSL